MIAPSSTPISEATPESIAEATPISIWGAGCAGLSLARYLAPHLRSGTLSRPLHVHGAVSSAVQKSHIWGFWQTKWLSQAAALSRKSWEQWQIITATGRVTQTSSAYPYHALDSVVWLQDCLAGAKDTISQSVDVPQKIEARKDDSLIFDSRTPDIPENSLLQHFIGLEIKTSHPVFDARVVTLMDFRCDQSRGIHFIYLLPFSANTALVESTLFSAQQEDREFYIAAINRYLRDNYQLENFQILREEAGCIPMNFLMPRDPALLAIGANGGCVRASSGYAFAFIQKQVQQIAQRLVKGQKIAKTPDPHRQIDKWLDRVFLGVLKAHPEAAPDLFLRMGRALTGDDLAKFMSGFANVPIYAKLILAMPKRMFIREIVPAFTRNRTRG
jgi:lycopene beta-cyclase